MTKAERVEKQKEKLVLMTEFERELWKDGNRYVAGVDEVGRGPLAGPVVAAAVILPEDFSILGVDDSKKLSAKKREELYDLIMDAAIAVSVGRREPGIIDEINILEATKAAMADAVNGLKTAADYVLVDAVRIPGIEAPQRAIIKGDARSVSIAAASIIAKVTRDREMEEMDVKYPGYAFASNKGYGTKAHYEGLAKLGPCPIHRKTFI